MSIGLPSKAKNINMPQAISDDRTAIAQSSYVGLFGDPFDVRDATLLTTQVHHPAVVVAAQLAQHVDEIQAIAAFLIASSSTPEVTRSSSHASVRPQRTYSVEVLTQPTGPSQTCAIGNGSGTMFGPAGFAARVNTLPKRSSRASSSSAAGTAGAEFYRLIQN